MTDRQAQKQALEVDVDVRLAEVWALAWGPNTLIAHAMTAEPRLAESVGLLLRAAYGKGYCDALREDKEGRRAELARANGYRTL